MYSLQNVGLTFDPTFRPKNWSDITPILGKKAIFAKRQTQGKPCTHITG